MALSSGSDRCVENNYAVEIARSPNLEVDVQSVTCFTLLYNLGLLTILAARANMDLEFAGRMEFWSAWTEPCWVDPVRRDEGPLDGTWRS